MTELIGVIAGLRRPRMLIRVARLGMQDYRRERDLRRLLGNVAGLRLEERLVALLAAEAAAEDIRRAGAAGYNLGRHLDLLIALLAEAQLAFTGAPSAEG